MVSNFTAISLPSISPEKRSCPSNTPAELHSVQETHATVLLDSDQQTCMTPKNVIGSMFDIGLRLTNQMSNFTLEVTGEIIKCNHPAFAVYKKFGCDSTATCKLYNKCWLDKESDVEGKTVCTFQCNSVGTYPDRVHIKVDKSPVFHAEVQHWTLCEFLVYHEKSR